MDAVVLVEGDSDRVALLTLARLSGLGLAGVDVVAMGGVTNLRRHLAALPDGVRVAGLYDAPAAAWVGRVLAEAGVPRDRFHACHDDLEDELLCALGVDAAEQVVADEGEARSLRRLAGMPAQRDWPRERLLRRFLTSQGGRKVRYGRAFVTALLARGGPEAVPAPLRAVLADVGIGPAVHDPSGLRM